MINSIKGISHKNYQGNNISFSSSVENDMQNSNSNLSKDILNRFRTLTTIYSETDHTDELRGYIKDSFKKEINHKFKNKPKSQFKVEELPYKDEQGRRKANILVTRNNVDPKNKNTVILQAHMDMVWVDERDKKSHKITILEEDGNIDGRPAKVLTADRTTLGADDHFGVASMMEIAKSDKYKDVPLQLLFTDDEETTTAGAVEFDIKKLAAPNRKDLKPEQVNSRKAAYINMDAEFFGNVIAACAGLEHFLVNSKPVPTETLESIDKKSGSNKSYAAIEIGLENTKGGHARDVDKGGINAFTEVFKAINLLSPEDKKDIHIAQIEGAGTENDKHNAIPKRADFKLFVSGDKKDKIKAQLNKSLEKVINKKKQDGGDPNLLLISKSLKDTVDKNTKVLSPEFQDKLIKVFSGESVKNESISKSLKPKNSNDIAEFGFLSGPYRKHEKKDDPCYGDLITSQNLGVLHITPNKSGNLSMDLGIGLRSSDKNDLASFKTQTHTVLNYLMGEKIKQGKYDHAPVWNQVGSGLANKAVEVYSSIGVDNTRQKDNHGCLEPSALVQSAEKAGKNIDFIAVGPNIRDPHTSNERIEVATIGKFINFMDKLIGKLASDGSQN